MIKAAKINRQIYENEVANLKNEESCEEESP